MSDLELSLLYEIAKGLHGGSSEGYIVEYGSMDGGTPCAFGLGPRDAASEVVAPVIAVDRYGWDDDRLPPGFGYTPYTLHYIEAREAYWRMELAGEFIAPVVTSSSILEFWNKPIRVLLIDSNHLYKPTLHDIVGSEPHFVPGAWLALDDYGSASEWCDGPALWATFRWTARSSQKLRMARGDMSILFIQVPEDRVRQ